ncbi:MAG: methyltransferase domain-containing protein [Dehalococcoidia bacterium]|nr:methyltransferase domain-containing protein [Dehalococcoidia bacterium]
MPARTEMGETCLTPTRRSGASSWRTPTPRASPRRSRRSSTTELCGRSYRAKALPWRRSCRTRTRWQQASSRSSPGTPSMTDAWRRFRRYQRGGLNVVRRRLAGLTLFGENISPEVKNDLYWAHLSIYLFFAGYVAGRRVLDLGCGSGYGTAHLADSGASEAVGVDLDGNNIRYARKRFAAGRARYQAGNAERLDGGLGAFEVVVSSNMFEHLNDVDAALDGVARHLIPGGTLIIAVPPITDSEAMAHQRSLRYHRTNLYAGDWQAKLRARYGSVQAYRHLPPAGRSLDFADPFPSEPCAPEFQFLPSELDELRAQPTLTAIFVCADPVQGAGEDSAARQRPSVDASNAAASTALKLSLLNGAEITSCPSRATTGIVH